MNSLLPVYTLIRRLRKYMRYVSVVSVLLLAAFPLIFYGAVVGWYGFASDWEAVLLQSSLQNGSFWLLPGHIIFQDSQQLVAEDLPIAAVLTLFVILLVPVSLGVALIYRTLSIIGKVKIFLGASRPPESQTLVDGSLVSSLMPSLRDEQAFCYGEYTISCSGRSLVVQVPTVGANPPSLFFDSTSNDIARREGRRLVFDRADELVFDGTTLEYFRIYANSKHHSQLVGLLTSEILAIIVKELDGAEIVLEGKTLTAIFDIRSVESEKGLQMTLESLSKLRDTLGGLSNTDSLGYQLRVARVDRTINLFGLAPVKMLFVQAMMWLTVGIYIVSTIAAGKHGLVGDVMFPVWIAGSFQIIGIHRLLKQRASLLLSRGVFTSDWGGLALRLVRWVQ